MDLKHSEVGAVCGVRELSTLRLGFNKLTSLPPLCSLKCCLANLQIEHNNIPRLGKHFLKGFKNLTRLNLSNNNLLVLPDLHWIQQSLSRIDAKMNKITSLDALQTSGIYERLYHVSVYRNDIFHFNVSLLRHMPKLDRLYLNDNNLTHIGDFRCLNVKVIKLLYNPWHCNEELSWMGEEDMSFEEGLTCATPTCLQGIAITDMSKTLCDKTRIRIEF